MNKSAYYPHRPAKSKTRLQKTGKNLFIQFIVCIILVAMIIGIKKFDFALSNQVAETFANQMQKDASISTIFNTGTEKAKELSDAFKDVSTRILTDNSTFAFSVPTDSTEAVQVFANDGRQVGLDFPVTGDEMQIYTAAAGTVTEIGTSDKIGRYIKVNHAKDIFTIYGHCTNIYVNPMDKVKKGDLIASVNSSENPVFRFEMYKDGKAVNPEEFFKQ